MNVAVTVLVCFFALIGVVAAAIYLVPANDCEIKACPSLSTDTGELSAHGALCADCLPRCSEILEQGLEFTRKFNGMSAVINSGGAR